MKNEKEGDFAPSELVTKATASLDASVAADLQVSDPDLAKAKAILLNTTGKEKEEEVK